MKTKHLPLLVIVLISLVLRIIFLDKIPAGISDDELDYVLNAKAIFLTGKDITQTWSPFSLTTPPMEFPKAELPYIVISPLIGIMNFSLFSARLPFVILNIFLIAIIFFISKRLFGKDQAFIIGLVAAINPWNIYFARTAFDAPLATLFLLAAFYIALIAKKWKILLSLPLLFFGFYSYAGIKTVFLPFVFLISFFCFYFVNKREYLTQYFLLCLLSIFIFFFFLIPNSNNKAFSRLSELLTPNHPQISQIVNKDRQNSVYSPLVNVFSNKLTTYTKESFNKFLGFYSSQFLFLYGDGRSTFSIYSHGMFYLIDAIFLIIGFYTLYKKYKTSFFLILGMLIIGPLPSVISSVGTTYPIRSFLTLPFLIMIIGIGIWQTINLQEFKKHKKVLILFVIFLYCAFLTNYMYLYFLRNPVYNSEGFGFSGRELSKYLDLAQKKGQDISVIINNSNNSVPSLFKQYMFYTNSYNSKTSYKIAENINKKTFQYNNISFINCPEKNLPETSIVIAETGSKCKLLNNYKGNLTIGLLSDGGEIYKIFNDSICKPYELKRYPEKIELNDFEVEKLSEQDFCNKFITNFN